LHFLEQHYSGCFSEVLNFVTGGKKRFQGVSVVLLVSSGEGVGGFGRLEVSSIEYDMGTAGCRAWRVSASLQVGTGVSCIA